MVDLNAAPRLSVAEVRLYEREVRFRLPFRFGVVTLTGSPQAFVRVRVRLQDGREGWGMAAEMLAPKWFDKSPDLSNEDNYAQLRLALAIAAELYRDAGPATAFGLFAACYRAQIDAGARRGLNPLVAGYGPALIDRAVLDAACRLSGVSFFQAVRGNLPGIETADLAPDLAGFDMAGFLAALRPAPQVHARHTVGLVDPIAGNPEPVGDGLPETLAEVVATYGQRYFKVKVGGDLARDLARLAEIAAVLDRSEQPYHVTLDGNEQYADAAGVATLWEAMAASPALQRLLRSILFIEQPLARAVALDADVSELSARRPVIIDESDATLDAFLRAKAKGYRGVSSKACKGLYKSLINAARCRLWNRAAGAGHYFMSGEDLTTQPGVAVQQDLALASLIGISHVERNGHHYVNGMSGVPEREQAAFLAAHPDLYHRAGGVVRLTIRDGRIALGSLDCRGLAAAAEPQWSAMRETPLAPAAQPGHGA
jgi:L-alanine-DL-glutamate epimerase-like enolase superfamily enzyme